MTAEPGLTPRFPVMMLEPVLVTVWPPSTAKLCSVPSGGAAAAAADSVLARPAVRSTLLPLHAARMRTASNSVVEILMAISPAACTIGLPLDDLRVVTAGLRSGKHPSYTEQASLVCSVANHRMCSFFSALYPPLLIV